MKTPQVLFFSFISCFYGLFAGDVDPYHLAEDTNWYYHYNFEAANQSELAIEFQDEVDELISRISEFDLIDLDPSKDLNSFTLYGNHIKQKSVAILKGNFSASLLYTIDKSDMQTTFLNGYKIYEFKSKRKGKSHFVTLHENKFVVGSNSKDNLASALNVINGLEPHLEFDNDLLVKSSIASLAIDDIDLVKEKFKEMGKTVMLNLPVEKIYYSVKDNGTGFTSEVNVISKPDMAKGLEQIVSGYLGIAKSYIEGKPVLKSILESIEVSSEGDVFNVTSTISNEDLKPHIAKMLEKIKNYKQKKSEK